MFKHLKYNIDDYWRADLILRDIYDFKRLIENFNNFKKFYNLENKELSLVKCLLNKFRPPINNINYLKQCFIDKNTALYYYYKSLDIFVPYVNSWNQYTNNRKIEKELNFLPIYKKIRNKFFNPFIHKEKDKYIRVSNI